MSKLMIVIVISVLIYLTFRYYARLKVMKLKFVTDDAFIAEFSCKYRVSDKEEIIRARNVVAGYFGLPPNRITIDLKPPELEKVLISSPSYSLALNDITYDLSEYYKSDPKEIELPETAGELVNIFVAKFKHETSEGRGTS